MYTVDLVIFVCLNISSHNNNFLEIPKFANFPPPEARENYKTSRI